VRTRPPESARPTADGITAGGLPEAVTNRIFSVTLTLGGKQMTLGGTSIQVRPLLIAAGKQVGAVGMAVDAPFDRVTGCVTLEPNKSVTIALLLNEVVKDTNGPVPIRLVVLDPATDAELFRSPNDIPVKLME
jgi:hypothetical protein